MEENFRKPEIKYSDPVREIMGNPPRKILLWGTSLILLVLVLSFLFAKFLKYPDLILSPIEITTEIPPVIHVSKVSGKIKDISVKDNDTVDAGKILAVMETTVSVEQYEILKRFTDTVRNPELLSVSDIPDLTELGSLQNSYSAFRKNLSDFNNFMKNDLLGNRIRSSIEELSKLSEYIDQLKENEQFFSQDLESETSIFDRQSKLVTGQSITEVEYERAKQALLEKKIALGLKRSEIKSKEIEYTIKEQQLIEIRITQSDEIDRFKAIIEESFTNLKAQIASWENEYLLKSTISGIVTFIGYWSKNQTVKAGDQVMAVVPLEQGAYIGRLELKMMRSGKVDTGRLVNIKLSSYPYLEYGMIRGVVKSKSLVASDDVYSIEVGLPDGLKTLYGNDLRFSQNMQGTAEIITDDKSLLEKVIYPFRYLYTKNRR